MSHGEANMENGAPAAQGEQTALPEAAQSGASTLDQRRASQSVAAALRIVGPPDGSVRSLE